MLRKDKNVGNLWIVESSKEGRLGRTEGLQWGQGAWTPSLLEEKNYEI